MSQPLSKPLRSQLEATVKSARDVAEKGTHAALTQLAVGEAKAPDYLSDDLKALRRRLRAHGRALGDAKAGDDTQGLQPLVWETGYEHWHRMLFARFLAENGLLLWEPGAAVSLDDCEALVQETDPAMNLGAKTQWELAGKLAARMLPQVFKPQSPVFELAFAPEHQRELERLLAALPPDVFKASDSLGWVYQFWQAKRKDEVNASEVKIGADELPAVTQLFTEPYMVDFLLHNSLGAWWVTRHPGSACPVPLTYLRTLDDGTPAAGKFEGWPDRLDDFKLLDPCCGSGHFLVAAFLLLVPMRMAAEGLSAIEAVDAVLAENLHGLEIDARCVEIAVFALALTAWRYPDENGDPLGVRKEMPAPQIACCGLKVAAKPEDWMALVPDDAPNAQLMRQELRLLHASFAQAPLLGSLLDPARSLKDDLATSSLETLRKLLERALASERPTTTRGQVSQAQNDGWDMALTAKGVLEAAALLGQTYELVVTNVPYLTGKRMSEGLGDHAKRVFPDSKSDLATVFLERAIEFCSRGGVSQLVMTQNWLFLAGYKKLREKLLQSVNINLLAKLGGGAEAFESGPGNITNICLLTVTKVDKNPTRSLIRGIDVSERKTPPEKAALLITKAIACRLQEAVLANPDSVITTDILASSGLLSDFVEYSNGIQSGDSCRFTVNFWELSDRRGLWDYIQTPSRNEGYYCGIDSLFRWDSGRGDYWNYVTERLGDGGQRAWIRGLDFRGRGGVAISATGNISCCLYFGEFWNDSVLVLTPNDPENLSAVYAFCKSSNFEADVRLIDQKLNVRSAVTKVRFDVQRWREAAAALLPEGIPKAFTNDVAEAAFHGHPQPTTDPIQVAVARLAGYRWPAETDTAMELADAKPLRSQLEEHRQVRPRRGREGARAALAQLAVGEAKAPDYLSDDLKALRRRLRAHGRALGDVKASDDTQACSTWCGKWPTSTGTACCSPASWPRTGCCCGSPGARCRWTTARTLVTGTADPAMNLGAKTQWELAGKLAARMLPQVFKPQSPVFELAFAPEHQRELERLLAALPPEVFKASDSLGWVYQFWQAKRKDEVNASEVKIGADELPAVTQLFTEPYMVDFLLHNSLGAWWVTRHPGKPARCR
jgi:hypothetical protein